VKPNYFCFWTEKNYYDLFAFIYVDEDIFDLNN